MTQRIDICIGRDKNSQQCTIRAACARWTANGSDDIDPDSEEWKDGKQIGGITIYVRHAPYGRCHHYKEKIQATPAQRSAAAGELAKAMGVSAK